MKAKNNEIWALFASVKLALFTFFILAVTSIIGTVIPQGKEMGFYIENFGAGTAKLFQLLNVPDMYNSWWFVSLLALFSLNLIVCTIDRFPNIWRLVTMDNLALGVDRIIKMPKREVYTSELDPAAVKQALVDTLASSAWRFTSMDKEHGTLFAAQKGNWTRLGVITVHVSILVIFIGAIIGSALGFKASVMITEGRSTNKVYLYDGQATPVDLDFEVRCDRFELLVYDTGAPKEFTSDLVVLKDGKEVLSKSIEVNDPLQFGGLTFYQSSYQAIDNAVAVELEKVGGEVKKFFISPGREVTWPEEGVRFGIVNVMGGAMGQARFKIWFKDEKAAPSQFWVDGGKQVMIERPDSNFAFSARPLFATGLQVTKDPGVWYVYLGCIMMLVGLYIAFFLSHRKVWLYITEEHSKTQLHVTGTSNKNKLGFDNDFMALTDHLVKSASLKLTKEGS
ncbi:MAG: cytochrome c biogenesis protein ResB [Proteobacteria bacterium]|nr:cytochrome c biogenesis protein ResB [Pseudomonadota bacterium]MBU1688223.1 cytochrome c biogenesis protein ResB [Pseudomonadota bacterium]